LLSRLDEPCGGELQKAKWLMKGLPSALELAPSRVADAFRETEKQLAEIKRRADAEQEALRRASFHPSAYLLGTETRPTQITIYDISGGAERWRRIPLDLSQPAGRRSRLGSSGPQWFTKSRSLRTAVDAAYIALTFLKFTKY
jgi:hypothetical protein